jgi:thioredoxin 2
MSSGTGTTPSQVVTCPRCGKRNRVPAVAGGVPRCGNCHQHLPWIVDAGDDDFTEVAERSPVPAVVDMWATWCGPCRMVSPALEQLATERAGEIKLVKVDVDAAPRLAQRFEVQAVPTLMVLRDGEVIARQPGAVPLPALRNWLDAALRTKGGEER